MLKHEEPRKPVTISIDAAGRLAFKKNAAGEWYCLSCGKLKTEHTQEDFDICSTETTVDKDGTIVLKTREQKLRDRKTSGK